MKKIISFILSICICITVLASAFSVSAAVVNKGIITIGSTAANTGDEISIPIDISENPGIMAITISITYNSKSLQFIEFLEGKVIKDYTVVDHPDKNIIRFVSCESTNRRRNDTLITLRFKVKDNAEWEFSKIDIKYSQGDFCNWDLDKIMPTVVSGGVDIAYNGSNCSHKNYGEWKIIAEPTCDSEGVKERICPKCNHVDSQKIEKVGHEFPEEWTIETVATKDNPGTMVRYCITCNNFCDRIEYTVEDSEKGEFDNEIGTEIPKNDVIKDNFQEQNPDKDFTPVNPPIEQKPQTSSQVSSSANSSSTVNSKNDTSSKPTSSSNSEKKESSSQNNTTVSNDSSVNSANTSSKVELSQSSVGSSVSSKPNNKKPPSIKDVFGSLFGNSSTDGDKNEQNENSEQNTEIQTPEQDGEISTDSYINSETTNKSAAIKAKIMEVFPNYEVIEESFKTSFIILILLILL